MRHLKSKFQIVSGGGRLLRPQEGVQKKWQKMLRKLPVK